MSGMREMKSTLVVKGLLAGTTLVAALAFGSGQLAAANLGTSAVGRPVTVDGALFAANRPDLFARAGDARNALGFPVGATRTGRHVHDTVQGADYDEISEVDSAGRPIAITQFATSGNLTTAVRFDSPPSGLGSVTSDAATKAAQRAVAGAGVTVAGQARTEANQTLGGWDVHWTRARGAYAVRGDETRVHVWQDGRIQSVAHVEHALATEPAQLLVQADARGAVTRQCDAWFAGTGSKYSLQGMDLEWVGPNAAFDPGKVQAATAAYRLAWVANVRPSGPAADSVQLITLYVDAGSGAIIGGDVVE